MACFWCGAGDVPMNVPNEDGVHNGVHLLELTDTRSSSINVDTVRMGEALGTESESVPISSKLAALQRCCNIVRVPLPRLGVVDEEIAVEEEPCGEFERVLA